MDGIGGWAWGGGQPTDHGQSTGRGNPLDTRRPGLVQESATGLGTSSPSPVSTVGEGEKDSASPPRHWMERRQGGDAWPIAGQNERRRLDTGLLEARSPRARSLRSWIAAGVSLAVCLGSVPAARAACTLCSSPMETPDNGQDDDGDGIELQRVLTDSGSDSTFSSTNELTSFFLGWDEDQLALGFDYTIEKNAIIWYLDLGISGGETSFLKASGGYSGAFPTNVSFSRDMDFMAGLWGDQPLYLFNVFDNASEDVTAQGTACRTSCASDGRAGKGFARASWDTLYGLGPGQVPEGAVIWLVGLIRAQDNYPPADAAPDNPLDQTFTRYVQVPIDVNRDGLADLDTFADVDGDGSSIFAGDCDDAQALTYPGATEVCDGQDNNCDGQIDEDLLQTFYLDADGDGYGISSAVRTACARPAGYADQAGDCQDGQEGVNPGAQELCNGRDDDCDGQQDEGLTPPQWYLDADGDGYGTEGVSTATCTPPAGYVAQAGDCQDENAAQHPGALEQCNGQDDNCDKQIDEGVTDRTWYLDEDGDGYGVASSTSVDCAQPTGYAPKAGDCDDGSSSVSPGTAESCDGKDQDCDLEVDEGVLKIFYTDEDGDGFGDPTRAVQACVIEVGMAASGADCNDARADTYPGADEVCDSLDQSCDGQVDEGLEQTFYADADGDGFGETDSQVEACAAPDGYVASGGDCDDTQGTAFPGAQELCNGVDDDCDGVTDEEVATTLWYRDADEDGFGSSSGSLEACAPPVGYVGTDGDCQDGNQEVHPGAQELCNGQDDDCDRAVDEETGVMWYPDADGDGWGVEAGAVEGCDKPTGTVSQAGDCDDSTEGVHPKATETCDGLDQDCDGSPGPDEADADEDGMRQCEGDCDDSQVTVYPGAEEVCDGLDNDCQPDSLNEADDDGDGVLACLECDDTDASIYPGALELCDGKDTDCDPKTEGPAGDLDQDKDGYPLCGADCDDLDAAISPDAQEIPGNDVDENCDGLVDDQDGDGVTVAGGDCNDDDPSVSPEKVEVCDEVDNDCDGEVDPIGPELCDGLDNNCNGEIDEGLNEGPDGSCLQSPGIALGCGHSPNAPGAAAGSSLWLLLIGLGSLQAARGGRAGRARGR